MVAGLFALGDELLGMIRVFEVPVSIKGAGMAGDELISMIDSEPIGIDFEGQWRSGILGRD